MHFLNTYANFSSHLRVLVIWNRRITHRVSQRAWCVFFRAAAAARLESQGARKWSGFGGARWAQRKERRTGFVVPAASWAAEIRTAGSLPLQVTLGHPATAGQATKAPNRGPPPTASRQRNRLPGAGKNAGRFPRRRRREGLVGRCAGSCWECRSRRCYRCHWNTGRIRCVLR